MKLFCHFNLDLKIRRVLKISKSLTLVPGLRAEDRGQKTEDGRQKTEDGRRKTEDGRQKTKEKRRKTEDRRQKTDFLFRIIIKRE